jgi:hypothetical protein
MAKTCTLRGFLTLRSVFRVHKKLQSMIYKTPLTLSMLFLKFGKVAY